MDRSITSVFHAPNCMAYGRLFYLDPAADVGLQRSRMIFQMRMANRDSRIRSVMKRARYFLGAGQREAPDDGREYVCHNYFSGLVRLLSI